MIMIRNLFVLLSLLGLSLAMTGCELPNGADYPNKQSASQSDARPAASREDSKVLKLSIKTEKSAYFIGEPIYIIATLINVGNEALKVHGDITPGEGSSVVMVTSGNGKSESFEPIASYDNDSSVFHLLKPKEEVGAVYPIFFGGDGWVFSHPGKYMIRTIYETPGKQGAMQRVMSNTIEITVVKPSDGSGEMLVNGDDPASIQAGKFMLWQSGDHLAEGIALLDTISKRFPKSETVNYIKYAKAKSLSQPFTNYLTKQVREAQCGTTLRVLNEINSEKFASNLLVQMKLARVRCEIINKNYSAAKKAVAGAKALVNNRSEYRIVQKRVDEYLGYLSKS